MELIDYPLGYQRHKTRVVHIGNTAIGGKNPICIQSMLTSATTKIADCLQEIRALNNVGCNLVRLAIPSRKDLDAVPEIKRLLNEEGTTLPLIADIHYSPQLAIDACELFEKIRINPGNYSDRPKSSDYKTDGDYFADGHLKLKEAIQPLAKNLKKYKRALRIGVNQGSLSTRMMEKFGDSPLGMVQSALEMVELLEELGFFQIVVSLKSSNPITVQKAFRLLVAKGPKSDAVALHLGVTEAGNDIMGRIKSLVGIGSLLVDGIGDTIRVSLTEAASNEVVFAQKLLSAVQRAKYGSENDGNWQRRLDHLRISNKTYKLGDLVIGNGSPLRIGQKLKSSLPKTEIPLETDFTYEGENDELAIAKNRLAVLRELNFHQLEKSAEVGSVQLVDSPHPLQLLRMYYKQFSKNQKSHPVGIIYPIKTDLAGEVQIGAILSEGLIDFLLIPEGIEARELTRLLNLLQAARSRILTTEYITCPSCARTLFDIESAVAKIKKRTHHLKGVKIGVMGCIVNGPGEMADADFGYVGSGNGKIDLYFGQTKVQKGIDEADAVERLIELIKEKGRWR